MVQFFNSWRESPDVPRGWQPAQPPGAVEKVRLNNRALAALLKQALPGRWQKVYHKGQDGTELHYCQHQSGKVAFVKLKVK
jgi:hypothetical protein